MKEQETRACKSIRIAIAFAIAFASHSLVLIPVLSATAFPATVAAVDQSSLTVILVRHAEKKVVPPENKDPDLSPAGLARAEELAKMFWATGIGAIYATQFKRTQQTVKPLADKLGLTVTQVEAQKTSELVKQIRSRNAGQVIFIAGHNNSVPEIIAALGGPKLPIIPETEYDNLYILTVQSDGSAKLLKLKYSGGQEQTAEGSRQEQAGSGGSAAFRAVSLWLTGNTFFYEAMPPTVRWCNSQRGVASDNTIVFGKP